MIRWCHYRHRHKPWRFERWWQQEPGISTSEGAGGVRTVDLGIEDGMSAGEDNLVITAVALDQRTRDN